MKTFQSIQEERGEKAYKQAISMGLKYGGFGYWKDPQTNETVYKTENDTLVKVEPDQESELAAKGGPAGGDGRPDAMDGAGGAGGGMANAAGMLQMPGGGQGMAGQGIQGAPMPGQEKVVKERGWEPGPDGDTCAGPDAEEPGKVPGDSFVGRTNFLKWQAGPDGDNMNTVSAGTVMEGITSDIMKIDKARKFSNQSKYSGSVASGRMTDDEDKPKGTEKAKRIIKGDSASAAGAQTRGRLLSLGPKDGRVSGVKRAEDAVKKGREKEKEDKFNQVLANIKPDAKPERPRSQSHRRRLRLWDMHEGVKPRHTGQSCYKGLVGVRRPGGSPCCSCCQRSSYR